jgi:hypothetical protein
MSDRPAPDLIVAWQGWSGQRYDAAVYKKGSAPPVGDAGSVAMAVKRDDAGIAKPLLVDCFGAGMATLGPRAWLNEAKRRGATEVHIITPDRPGQAPAIVGDLKGDPPPLDELQIGDAA